MRRLPESPLISPADVSPTQEGLHVYCTINPAAAQFHGQTILLVRVGESAPASEDYVAHVHFDPCEQNVVVRHISREDPKLQKATAAASSTGIRYCVPACLI